MDNITPKLMALVEANPMHALQRHADQLKADTTITAEDWRNAAKAIGRPETSPPDEIVLFLFAEWVLGAKIKPSFL